MVSHQHIGMDFNPKSTRVLVQKVEHPLVICGGTEDVLSVVSAQNNVVRVVDYGETGQAGHDRQFNWNLTPLFWRFGDAHFAARGNDDDRITSCQRL